MSNIMLSRRLVVCALALPFVAASSAVAIAMERKPFDPEAFAAAQAAGRPVLLDVFASWCPVCRAQRPILSRLATGDRFKDFAYFEIDFDRQKDVLRSFRVQQQSTLIAFKGRQEVARSTGVTNPAAIEALLAKAL